MSKSWILVFSVVAIALAGCISAERKAEYAAWQASDDGVRTVMLEEFESKYQQGWRERAAEKKKARLAREEAEEKARLAREEAEEKARLAREKAEEEGLAWRKKEYERWIDSSDFVLGTELEEFEQKYKEGWEERVEYKRWLSSDDKEEGVSLEVFEQKYKKGWELRAEQKKLARLEREENERLELKRKAALEEQLRKRDEARDKESTDLLKRIRECYGRGQKFVNPFRPSRSEDWVATLTDSRLELSESDKLAGEAILSEFGYKYMPNAYANYEKMKEVAIELQQVFNEEFPEPWKIGKESPQWRSFNKMLEKLVKARTEYFRCHDELCYYWSMQRFGVMNAEDLAQVDSRKIAVKLLPENTSRVGYTPVPLLKLNSKDGDFALKYAPESYALYLRLEQEWKQTKALLDEVNKQRDLLDDIRFNRAEYNAQFKCNDIAREINALVSDFQAWNTDHRMMEKSAEEISKCDQDRARGLKSFVDSLPIYVKDRTLGRVIPQSEMIPIPYAPGGFKLQRTEVTQMQWMIVMGNNPSKHVKPDCPVENVSWHDCMNFINKVSEMDEPGVRSGFEYSYYRLPSEAEWEFACRAGSRGDWGKRRNGEEGPFSVMGWVIASEYSKTHSVAMKEPNAWGLYDMHGNVWEWTSTCEEGYRVFRGGNSSAGERRGFYPSERRNNLGLRLVVDDDVTTSSMSDKDSAEQSQLFKPDIVLYTSSGGVKGRLVKNGTESIEIEVSPGVVRSFPRTSIRRVEFLEE